MNERAWKIMVMVFFMIGLFVASFMVADYFDYRPEEHWGYHHPNPFNWTKTISVWIFFLLLTGLYIRWYLIKSRNNLEWIVLLSIYSVVFLALVILKPILVRLPG